MVIEADWWVKRSTKPAVRKSLAKAVALRYALVVGERINKTKAGPGSSWTKLAAALGLNRNELVRKRGGTVALMWAELLGTAVIYDTSPTEFLPDVVDWIASATAALTEWKGDRLAVDAFAEYCATRTRRPSEEDEATAEVVERYGTHFTGARELRIALSEVSSAVTAALEG